jgi:hypothetical protein
MKRPDFSLGWLTLIAERSLSYLHVSPFQWDIFL